MRNKQIIRTLIQTFLVMIAVFVILEFYQYDEIPYIVKWVSTIVLMVANCAFSHWCGLRNGIEMSDRHNERMNELRKQNFDKIIDIVSKEKFGDKAGE